MKYAKEDSEELSDKNFGDDSIQFHHFDHWDEANHLFKKIKEKCKSKIGRSCVLLDCQKLTKLKQAGLNTEGQGVSTRQYWTQFSKFGNMGHISSIFDKFSISE